MQQRIGIYSYMEVVMRKMNRRPLRFTIAGGFVAAVLVAGQMGVLANETVPENGVTAGATTCLSCTESITISDIEGIELTAGAATAVAAVDESAEQIALEQSKLFMANVEDAVNVRTEPNEEAELAGKLFKDCGGEILEETEGWTKIKSGDLEGWVKNDFLLFDSKAAELREEVGSLTATVETEALRIRTEADENSEIYDLAELGEELEAVEEAGDWVKVELPNDQVGYVSADYVSVEFTVDSGKTMEQIEAEEEAKRKAAEEAERKKNRGAVATSGNDVALLAALIQCEAGSQPYEGKLAVGAVVMNRVRSGAYPNSIQAVITAPGQFPPAVDGKVASVLASGASSSCVQAAQEAINGASNVGGALHFGGVGKAAGIVIGGHVFY